jgi:hypothetical protein
VLLGCKIKSLIKCARVFELHMRMRLSVVSWQWFASRFALTNPAYAFCMGALSFAITVGDSSAAEVARRRH